MWIERADGADGTDAVSDVGATRFDAAEWKQLDLRLRAYAQHRSALDRMREERGSSAVSFRASVELTHHDVQHEREDAGVVRERHQRVQQRRAADHPVGDR